MEKYPKTTGLVLIELQDQEDKWPITTRLKSIITALILHVTQSIPMFRKAYIRL